MTRRTRRLALVVAVALAGALVLPSAAAPLFAGQADQVRAGVTLAPSSEYASLADGELVVDLAAGDADGVNPDAVTAFDDVFTVRYSGSRHADVWLTHDSEAVTFYARGEPVESAANSVTLGPDDSVAVGVRVDTTGTVVDTVLEGVTVHSRVAESGSAERTAEGDTGPNVRRVASTDDSRQFTVLRAAGGEPVALNTTRLSVVGSDATLDELAVTRATGGPLSVTVTRAAPSAAGPLPAGDGAEALGAVRVSAGDNERAIQRATFRFSVARDYLDAVGTDAGDLTLYRHSGGEWSELDGEVVGERGGRVVVEAVSPGFSTFVLAAERSAVGVETAALESASVTAGDSVNVTADVANTGGAAGERTVALTLDGTVAAERTVALGPGETTTVTFTVTPSPGEYDVRVGGVDAGHLVVEAGNDEGTPAPDDQSPSEADSNDADSDAAPEDGTPVAEPAGIGLSAIAGVSALLVLVVATLVLVRRRSRG